MRGLEGRAEEVLGTFNAQEVAKTLWAYARMGREPGAGLMPELEERAEELAGTFTAQNVANRLWVLTLGTCDDGEGARGGLDAGAGGAGRGGGGHVHCTERG